MHSLTELRDFAVQCGAVVQSFNGYQLQIFGLEVIGLAFGQFRVGSEVVDIKKLKTQIQTLTK